MNDSQKHHRRLFVNKLLGAYNTKEKPHIITLADAYVEGHGTIDSLWKEIREDAP
jgi:hypothetical protein